MNQNTPSEDSQETHFKSMLPTWAMAPALVLARCGVCCGSALSLVWGRSEISHVHSQFSDSLSIFLRGCFIYLTVGPDLFIFFQLPGIHTLSVKKKGMVSKAVYFP